MMAVSCGTPTPATMRVVQIEPGPMPTLIASAPASISAWAPSAVAMLPATTCTALDRRLMRLTASSTRREWPCAVSTTTRSTPASISRSVRAKPMLADGGGGRDPQAALLVLAGVRIRDRLLDVLDGDQADAAVLVVDHQQLLDAVLMQQALGLVLADALAHRDEPVLGHQFATFWRGSVAKRTSRLVRMPTSLPAGPVAAGPPPGCRKCRASHQRERIGERRIGPDGDRIDHHAGLELLDLADLRGLLLRLEVAVDDADAAGLRHGDRHLGLGHGVHGGGDDRDVERGSRG